MTSEKELTIQFLKMEAPEFYQMIVETGKIDTLSDEELTHLYASSLTEPIVDISDISAEELPVPNTEMVEIALKKSKERSKPSTPHTLNFFIKLRRFAMAASVLLCFGLAINVIISSNEKQITFIDETSQETTDYAIRVRNGAESTGIFKNELNKIVKEIVLQNIRDVDKDINCTLKPDTVEGDVVYITISTENKSSSAKITLTNTEDVKKQLISIIPKMLE